MKGNDTVSAVIRIDLLQVLAMVCLYYAGIFVFLYKWTNDVDIRLPGLVLSIAGFGLLLLDELIHSKSGKEVKAEEIEAEEMDGSRTGI